MARPPTLPELPNFGRRFLAVAAGVGLCRDTSSCAGIPGLSTPVFGTSLLAPARPLTAGMMPLVS